MAKQITLATVREMLQEMDQMEAQAERELKSRSTRGLGLLRKDLVEECRRSLGLMTIRIKMNKSTQAGTKAGE